MSQYPMPVSGAIHYFRVHHELWDDRLAKAVDFGLDTVETYIAWNGHEPHRGEYNFSGMYDIEEFLRKCAAHGLKVILRPGPYICAEWDNGGFPGWLLAVPGIRLRCMNEPYLQEVKRWFDVLLPKLRPFMADMGGPVIYLQLENEYGSYGNDTEYMQWVKSCYLEHGFTGEFITSDGPGGYWAAGGLVPGVFGASNFGSNPDEAFAAMRVFRPDGPDFCMEFWDGWFDHWGEKHHIRPRKDGKSTVAPDVETMLKRGAGMNFYMFHGGTNFGLTAGANGNKLEDYAATITSYDYGAPLSECGDPTEDYYECRALIRKYCGRGGEGVIAPSRKIAPAAASYTGFAPMTAAPVTKSGKATVPPTLEELGENWGAIRYRTRMRGPVDNACLNFLDVNDYVQVRINGELIGTRYRPTMNDTMKIAPIPREGVELEVTVESTGHINYGPYLGRDRKGIAGSVCLDLQAQFHWEYELMPLQDAPEEFGELPADGTAAGFRCATFTVEGEPGDTFIEYPGIKGQVWVNGFNLGRYWDRGPSETLYVPAPVLKSGENRVVVMEWEKFTSDKVTFTSEPRLGIPEQG